MSDLGGDDLVTDDDRRRFAPRDVALLEAAAWLQRHPANAPGTDKTFVLRALRRVERLIGRVRWPPKAELPPRPGLLDDLDAPEILEDPERR